MKNAEIYNKIEGDKAKNVKRFGKFLKSFYPES